MHEHYLYILLGQFSMFLFLLNLSDKQCQFYDIRNLKGSPVNGANLKVMKDKFDKVYNSSMMLL